MANWDDIARDNLQAAGLLQQAGHYRSSISRSYYAAFSAVTLVLQRSLCSMPNGWETPQHRDVPQLIEKTLRNRLKRPRLSQLKLAIRRLYRARLEADYRSVVQLRPDVVRDARRDACYVFRMLGVNE